MSLSMILKRREQNLKIREQAKAITRNLEMSKFKVVLLSGTGFTG